MMFSKSFFCPSKELNFLLALLCILIGLAVCGPCATLNPLMRGMDGMADHDACGSFGDNSGSAVQEFFVGEMSLNYVQGNSPTISGLKAVCMNSELFCFPSTLHTFLAGEDSHKASSLNIIGSQGDATLPGAPVLRDSWESNSSWLAKHGTFSLLNGKIVSCSLNSAMKPQDVPPTQGKSAGQSNNDSGGGSSLKYHRPFNILDKKSELITSDILDGSSSPNVDISPPFLDWGQSPLYLPSLAFLTVANTCNESSIHIYKPFSTDTQFYPCDFDEVLLGPGEVARICFVFLPQQLGPLSAHIVLQTSAGGFLIHAKGVVIESLYQIQPLVGLNVSLDGGLKKNLSLYNPFDDTLYVKDVTVWISFSSDNITHSAEAVCKMDNFQSLEEYGSFLNIKEWLDIRSDQVDLPLMALRPHRSWEINPHSTETIVEINFLSGAKGNIFGALSMEVQSSSQDKTNVIVVPLEAEVHGKSAYSDLKGSVLVYLESIPCEGCDTSIVLSLKNEATYLLRVAKISEVTESTKFFHIKYMDGLLLFPGSLTQIAVITCPLGDSKEPPDENFEMHLSCKLLVLTNDSGNPQIEIPCQDVVQACSRHHPLSYIGHELQLEKSKSGGEITGSLGNFIHSPSGSSLTKSEKIAQADELVLRNWRSQGTTSSTSVLDHDKVLYPVVQVGSHCSKWITVKNPSQQPVFMQLILNSGTVIDQCRSPDKFVEQPLSSSLVQNESTIPARYGFSIAETAITEAFVHPHGKALLGPIIFHPSSRCGWSGSALIRNNLSGVEWLSLKGYGGSLSLVLLEGSEPIKSLEFNLNLPNPLNISPQETLFHLENTSAACSMLLWKEFYAMNTGDLPLEVRKIEVSGTKCGLDGFMVHACKAFALEPGESRKLRISYKTDFSAAVVHRDLELALVTGNFVIPMKASLPVHMLSVCRKSFLWVLLRKFSLLVFIAACVTFVVFSFILPKLMAFNSQDYVFKTEKATIRRARKPCVERDERKSKFSMYKNVISLISSVRENETLKLGFVGRYSDCSSGAQEERTGQKVMPVQDAQEKIIGITGLEGETQLLQCSSEVKAVVLETSCSLEASQASNNLTVRVGKEKGKRRRKRRSTGAATGGTGLLELSSSQSGNSTPSSPMSPVISFAPKTTWSLSPDIDRAIEAGNPFVRVADQNHGNKQLFKAASGPTSLEAKVSGNYDGGSQCPLQPQIPGQRKLISKSVLLPSATFPCTNQGAPGVVSSPQLSRSTSLINPNARAPGSNLKGKSIVEEKKRLDDKFTYDIWGNHFSGFHLMDTVNEVSTVLSDSSEGGSHSFFARAPQILVQKSQEKPVFPAASLSRCAVTPLHQNG